MTGRLTGWKVIADDFSNHHLPIGALVQSLRVDDAFGCSWYTPGGDGDERAIDPRDLEPVITNAPRPYCLHYCSQDSVGTWSVYRAWYVNWAAEEPVEGTTLKVSTHSHEAVANRMMHQLQEEWSQRAVADLRERINRPVGKHRRVVGMTNDPALPLAVSSVTEQPPLLVERNGDAYYVGPLEPGLRLMVNDYAHLRLSFRNGGWQTVTLDCAGGENEWGNSVQSLEDAMRFLMGAAFGPLDSEYDDAALRAALNQWSGS